MSLAAEMAAAARAMNAHAARLPAERRPDLAELWAELTDLVEDCRSDGAAVLAVIEWRRDVEAKLATALAHSPLEATR